MAGDASQPGMVASAAELASGPARLNHEPVPARRLGIGSTVNDDLAFKSPGLKRDRATEDSCDEGQHGNDGRRALPS